MSRCGATLVQISGRAGVGSGSKGRHAARADCDGRRRSSQLAEVRPKGASRAVRARWEPRCAVAGGSGLNDHAAEREVYGMPSPVALC
jgi:hypothetical protein